MFFQGSILLVGMKFCEHVPNSLRNKSLKRLIPNQLKKVVFWASKTLLSTTGIREFFFFSTLNIMILQIVSECLRFAVHVDIQVSYKILQLEIPKEVFILHQPHGFQ
jgi:hypothetical protein